MATDPHTVECPHDRDCGACSLLSKPYSSQLEMKQKWLAKNLDRSIRIRPKQLLPTLPSPLISGYRNRVKMTISTDRERSSKLGYFERNTRNVIDSPDCRVLLPELLETTRQLRAVLNSKAEFPFRLRHIDLRCGSNPELQHLTLVVKAEKLPSIPYQTILDNCPLVAGIAVNLNPSEGRQVVKGRIEPVAGVREVFVDAAGLSLRVSPGSFFQVNLSVLPMIHEQLLRFLGKGQLLVDLYAGVGTHGFALREQFQRIMCVEGTRSAVADAKATISRFKIENVSIQASPVQRSLRRLSTVKPNAFILNPSRAGADQATLRAITGSSARRIAYLSCNPETLSRDLEVLVKGGFKLVSVQAVDMMPQTDQIESLTFLQR